jgi:diguanylate cyclase (GGDEF)-like protein/PAS domain S-box-containing protein
VGATQAQVQFLNQILDTAPNFVFLVDLQSSKLLYANHTFASFLGYTSGGQDDLNLSIVERIMHPEDLQAYQERFNRLQSSDEGEVVETELRLRDVNDDWRWFHCRATVFSRDQDGQPLQCLFTSQDITRRRRLEEQLKFLSFHDPLTGLPNRNYFEKEMARIERDRLYPVSVIMIDADDLKETNDSKGHAVGDALLTRIAVALKNVFRSTDLIARIGGDEFAILLPRTKEAVAAQAVGRLRREMETHNHQAEIPVNISIGFATADSPERLSHAMELADDRMYQEKFQRDGKGQRKRFL